MRKCSSALIILMLVLICGLMSCANHRDPDPCPMKLQTDSEMDCDQLVAEYIANTTAATNKIAKNKSGDGKDVLLGVLVWPGLADFKNADGTEGNALLDRNLYLLQLAKTKNCDVRILPKQPDRYK